MLCRLHWCGNLFTVKPIGRVAQNVNHRRGRPGYLLRFTRCRLCTPRYFCQQRKNREVFGSQELADNGDDWILCFLLRDFVWTNWCDRCIDYAKWVGFVVCGWVSIWN